LVTSLGDLKRAIAIQRDDPSESSLVIVVTYGYSLAAVTGMLLPDADALSETAEVLVNAEKSGDDVALALAQVAHGLLMTDGASTDHGAGLKVLAEGRDGQLSQRNLLGVAMADIRMALMKADAGDVDDAITLARNTVDELVDSGEMVVRGAASAAPVVALLRRGNDSDLNEAQTVTDELAAVPVETRFVVNDVALLRMRALLARARADDAAYADVRDRYRMFAASLGFDGHVKWAEEMP
jgi:adenylate cyclase